MDFWMIFLPLLLVVVGLVVVLFLRRSTMTGKRDPDMWLEDNDKRGGFRG